MTTNEQIFNHLSNTSPEWVMIDKDGSMSVFGSGYKIKLFRGVYMAYDISKLENYRKLTDLEAMVILRKITGGDN